LVVLLGLSGCGSEDDGPGASPTPTPKPAGLMLDFESGPSEGSVATTVANAGTGSVQTEVRATGSATVEVVPGPDGGKAVRFPAYTGAAEAPAAVLVAIDQDGGTLDPGEDEFAFGASFSIDEESSGSQADNGDNLVQRGTFDSPGQLKLQLDHDVPSCRIKGDAGEVFVEAEDPVDPGSWYSMTCERRGSDVQLTVKALDGGSGGGTWRGTGPTGRLELEALPLTVGGKTGPDGTPVASPDQFNGAVDDVFFRVE
jgi:hypothetical protein